MARNENVHIDNATDLLDAFRNIKCPYWALYGGRQLLTSFEVNDIVQSEKELEQAVDLFCGSSAGRYTLCIYRTHKPGVVITNKTEYTNSIDFRLNHSQADAMGEIQYAKRYGYVPGEKNTFEALKKMYDENNALKIQLAQEKMKLEAPGEETWADKVGGVVEALGLTDTMPYLGKILVDKIMGTNTATRAAGPNIPVPANPVDPPPADDKLARSIETLKQVVPDIDDTLWKLSQLAASDPDKFKFYMSHL